MLLAPLKHKCGSILRYKSAIPSCRAIHVGLEAPAGVEAVLYLSYVVTRASWSSAYDARVFTKGEIMKVSA